MCGNCLIRCDAPCAALDDAGLRDLERIQSHRRLCAGQTLIVEGERAEYAYIVISGGLKLVRSLADGRTQITGLLLPGDLLGIPPRGVSLVSAEGLTGTELCQLPRGPLHALFAKYPGLELRFLSAMYDDWASAQDHMLLLGRKSAVERVCTFLLGLAKRIERAAGTAELLNIPLQRAEIADYLGLTLETVSRVFSQLNRERIIRIVKANRIVIDDRPALEAIAAGG